MPLSSLECLKRQNLISDKIMTDPEYEGVDPRSFMVFDPLLETGWQTEASPMRDIFVDGVKNRLLRVMSMSYFVGMKTHMRDLVDWVFVFRDTIVMNKKRLYDQVCGMFPNQAIFDEVLDSVTENYGCLVIDNRPSSRGRECAFWYGADPLVEKTWRTCSDVFWDHYEMTEIKAQNSISI